MGDKLRRGKTGTDRFFKKHKGFKQKRNQSRRFGAQRAPSRYDPDARY